MKNIFFAFLAVTILLIPNCTNRGINSNNDTQSQEKVVLTDTLWQLKNRIPNCDSALAFMKHVIVPVKSVPLLENQIIIERVVTVKIPGEGLDLSKDERYKFYINHECLVGRKSDEIIKLFCTPETVDSFKEIDESFQERRKYWILSVGGFGNNLNIKFSEGKVVSVSYSKSVSSH